MAMSHCPDLIKDNALEALGKLVSELLVQLVKYPELKDKSLRRPNYVQEACSQFHEMFKAMVPPAMANEVTIKLLRYLDNSYRSLRMSGADSDIDNIASEILCAIIHPCVMRLDFDGVGPHPDRLDFYKTMAPRFTYLSLRKLKNLEVLNFGCPSKNMNGNYNLLYVPKKLKRFSSSVCNNKDIELLSKSCERLESLDFRLSPYVSDGCLEYLKKFRHLKELYLSRTKITQDGLTWLLNALCCTLIKANGGDGTCISGQLIGFGCNNPKQIHILLLASRFKNLETLELLNVQREICLAELKELKCLSHLTLGCSGDLQEVLKLIGPQLKCLNIALNCLPDFKWIYGYCSRVECLHLQFPPPSEPPTSLKAYFEANPLPEFPYVKRLHLILCNQYNTDYILSRFMNAKKFVLIL
jgi:hypothetical protein